MYWKNLDTTTAVMSVKLGTSSLRPGGAVREAALACSCTFKTLSWVGLIIHPLRPIDPGAAKPYGSPSGTISGVVGQTHTNVRDGNLAVVIAHEELMHCGVKVLT